MAIRWQVRFKSLRAGRLYTVNIYDDNYTGSPVELVGAAHPFETQEDDDDDMFKPVRTQSGYIRIVEGGYAADGVTVFNWRDLIPTTDTDRAVTLTHTEGNSTVTDWCGFMQAQNFGAKLYEKPLEREFPVQCPLSVLTCTDVSTTQKDIRNFAYLLWSTLNQVPATGRPNTIVVQGGADAQSWLLKMVDYSIFVEEDNKTLEPKAKCDYGELLEYICEFWGWTARTKGRTLYLTCADDTGETNALVLSYADLTTMAAGTSAGTVGTMFSTVTVGNIFASTNNDDYQERGPRKAVMKVDSENDVEVIAPFDDKLSKKMNEAAFSEGTYEHDGDVYWHYSKDVLTVDRYDLVGTCHRHDPDPGSVSPGYYTAAFCILAKNAGSQAGYGYNDVGNVIRIHKTYDGTTFLSLETKYEHCFSAGYFRMLAYTYRKGDKYENGDFYAGNPAMKMRLGVGSSRESAKWWDGRAWQSSACVFLATIGNKKEELFTRYVVSISSYEESSIIFTESEMCGRLYVDFLGTDDSRVDDINGEKRFDLLDFKIEYRKTDSVTMRQFPNSGYWDIRRSLYTPEMEYEAKNDAMMRDEHTINVPFGSNDSLEVGRPILMNADGSYMNAAVYAGDSSNPERPEVHLVNRIVNYWAASKRRISCELLAHDGSAATVADGISPRTKVMIDGSTLYPIAISRDWWDDVVMVTAMEVTSVSLQLVDADGKNFVCYGGDNLFVK